jgi:Protein of unknown function (DUF2589)
MNLEGLYDGICSAVQNAQATLEKTQLTFIDEYFETRSNGLLIPKVIRVLLANGETVEIPLFSLVPHKKVLIDTMKINLSVELDSLQPSGTILTHTCSPTSKNNAQIEINFKTEDCAENMERLVLQGHI